MVERLDLRGRKYLITRGEDGTIKDRVPATECKLCGEWVPDETHHMIDHASKHKKVSPTKTKIHKAFNRSMWIVLPILVIIGIIYLFINRWVGYLICSGTVVLWLSLMVFQFYAFGRWWNKT